METITVKEASLKALHLKLSSRNNSLSYFSYHLKDQIGNSTETSISLHLYGEVTKGNIFPV